MNLRHTKNGAIFWATLYITQFCDVTFKTVG